MITEPQLAEILNYLLSKKLPIDILIEVNDHFVSQISDLQREENLSFEDAFEKVKLSWKLELRMIYNPNYSLDDISIFMKKIVYTETIRLFKQSFIITFSTILFFFFLSWHFSEKIFFYSFTSVSSLVILIPLFQYFSNLKDFKLIKKYNNYRLTFYQNYATLTLVLLGSYLQFFFHLKAFSGMFYDSLRFLHDDNLSYSSIPLFALLFILNIYCYLNQKNYLIQIQKIKPFLKYLS